MKKKIIVVGAGRHGRNVIEILGLVEGTSAVAGFLDDTKSPGCMVDQLPVLGPWSLVEDYSFVQKHRWIVAIGDPLASNSVFDKLSQRDAEFISAIHPMSAIAETSLIGKGVYIASFVTLKSGCGIEDNVILESGSIVGADATVGISARLGPGSRLLGGARLGHLSFAGAGCTLIEMVCVGSNCRLGANSVIRKNVPDSSDAFGVPAKISDRKLSIS